MIYDPIELMKLNLTENSIQKMRGFIKDALIQAEETNVTFYYDYSLLQFVVDMFEGYKVKITPTRIIGLPRAHITIKKKKVKETPA